MRRTVTKFDFLSLIDRINNNNAGNAALAGDNTLIGTARADLLHGMDGNDTIIDAGRARSATPDRFFGDNGNDTIRSHMGRDFLDGGEGSDLLVSRSDAGEPLIAQDATLKTYFKGQPYPSGVTDDKLTGGGGNDTFLFRLDLDARPEIAAKHTDAAGNVDWHEVAGENGAAHLHWVNGIGTDTITDYSKAQGDVIRIEGHTAAIDITYQDLNKDGVEESIISIRSDQGGAGSHNGDKLGKIIVYGDRVEAGDVQVDAGVHHGAYGSLDELMV